MSDLDEILGEMRLEAVHPRGYKPNGNRFEEKLGRRGLRLVPVSGGLTRDDARRLLELIYEHEAPAIWIKLQVLASLDADHG